MGWNLSLIAFDQAPDLASAHGLLDFRLFKRDDAAEWYLEGPSKNPARISLFERPVVNKQGFGAHWTSALKEYDALVREVTRNGRRTFGLDDELILTALAISAALRARLLVVSGDDEDLDCAFICSNGRLQCGRFLVDEAEGMVFDAEAGSQIAQLDWSQGHPLYGEASIVAADFFNDGDAAAHTHAWQELEEGDYTLVASSNRSSTERGTNRLMGCLVIAVGFAALIALFTAFPALGVPVGGVLLVAALAWRYWPRR